VTDVNPDVVTWTVPDSLGGMNGVEALYAITDVRQPAEQFVLDMGGVSFVKPYGVVALIVTARRLATLPADRSSSPIWAVRYICTLTAWILQRGRRLARASAGPGRGVG
jgi:hypothetical protein